LKTGIFFDKNIKTNRSWCTENDLILQPEGAFHEE
jgi:hypothetical protein